MGRREPGDRRRRSTSPRSSSTISTHALRLSSADACGIFELDSAKGGWSWSRALGLDKDVREMLEQAPVTAEEAAERVGRSRRAPREWRRPVQIR